MGKVTTDGDVVTTRKIIAECARALLKGDVSVPMKVMEELPPAVAMMVGTMAGIVDEATLKHWFRVTCDAMGEPVLRELARLDVGL